MEVLGAVTQGVGAALDVGKFIAQLIRDGKTDAELQKAIQEAYGITIPPEQLMQIKADAVAKEQNLAADPELKGAQMDALRRMSQIGASGGMDPQSVAALQRSEEMAARSANSAQSATNRNLAATGMMDSGRTQASNMANAQMSANMANRAGVQAAGDARERALSAIAGSGKLAGDIQGAEDQRGELNRRSNNEIGMFNSKLKMDAANATAANMLGRTSAQVARSGRINEAAGNFADVGENRKNKNKDDPTDDMKDSLYKNANKLGAK